MMSCDGNVSGGCENPFALPPGSTLILCHRCRCRTLLPCAAHSSHPSLGLINSGKMVNRGFRTRRIRLWHLFHMVPSRYFSICTGFGNNVLPIPWTILDELRCVEKVLLTPFRTTRCALTEQPWETAKVSISIHVETLISLVQVIFMCARPSAQITIVKVSRPSKFGVKRLTFEYLTD